MILEGIVTTTNDDLTVNVSPMGPVVDRVNFSSFLLRPFQSSTTYRNLKRTAAGVLHVTDDVQVFVDGALRDFAEPPKTESAQSVEGFVLSDCCRFFEFQVKQIDDSQERTEIECSIMHQGEKRPFWGFNRAKHAVLEAAIYATRVHLVDLNEIAAEYKRLAVIVNKTAGPAEQAAFRKLEKYVQNHVEETCR